MMVVARALLLFAAAAVWLVLLFPFAVLAMVVTFDTGASLWWGRRVWAPAMFWAGNTRLVVQGHEHCDPNRPTVYLSNHQSTADIPALFAAIPVNFRFVAKSQLKWVPFLGWYLMAAKHVFVDRSNRQRAVRSIQLAAERIRSGKSILMFAEGTRSPDGRVLPFKKGPFVLALEAGVPICPITIEGSGRIMPKNSWDIRSGTIHVKIGAPIEVTPFRPNRREELMRLVRDRIIEQSLELGGLGGDRDDVVAAQGYEGIGRAARTAGEQA